MPFIPHTPEETAAMLAAIGVDSIEELFDEIPAELRCGPLEGVPSALTEGELSRLMSERAAADQGLLNFAGGGAYEHHIPAAVWAVASRGEYYSAYTPYQAEASQGSLQLIYEYQTMMAELMAMDVSNASLYDGATALAEALLMALRANRKVKARRVGLPRSVHPAYRDTVRTLLAPQDIELVELPFDPASGTIDPAIVAGAGELAAVVIPQPNYFGRLEDVHALCDAAHARGALVVAQVNPLLATILAPPGEWGERGADIACGEGQPLGVPLSSGGPYFGFLTCRQALVRQMPGRLVGRSVDLDGRPAYTLTLQAREQHIRRSKATSNICTNQGLMVTAATIYLALMGPEGLERTALVSHDNTRALAERIESIPGVERLFPGPFGHEVAVCLPRPAGEVIAAMAERGILAGIDLEADYPELGHALLLCATETKTEDDLDRYAQALREVLS